MADYNSPFTGAAIDAAITKANSAQQPPVEGPFVDGDKTKLDGIEAGADVTDTANVTAAGALMDSEVTNLAAVKAFDPTDYATAAQGGLADTAVQPGDDANTLGSGAATDGYVLTADGVGGAAWEVASGGGGTPAGSSGQFQFNDGGVFAAADLWQATNVVEQRNSTNAQTFNIYNTYTDASNYERGFMRWNSNEFRIGAESGGTGTNPPVILEATRVVLARTGVGAGDISFVPRRSNAFDIAQAGGGAPLYQFDAGWLKARYTYQYAWVPSNDANVAADTGLARIAAGVVKVTNGSTGTGEIIFIVPTTDPAIAGALWNNAGTLSISAG